MDEKISIILPIFNVGAYLKSGLDSLINQTIGKENLEIIMVDDCSTDGSGKIIDEYADRYECCRAIHLEKNTGAANWPRNRGLEAATGDYIMFLDSDDRYTPDACETLYDALCKNDADVAFGRYRRVFTHQGMVQKSYSPYPDNLEEVYSEDFEISNPLNVSNGLWEIFLKRLVYGKDIKAKYDRSKPVDVVKVDSIEEEPDLLKISPSIWCKIFKREMIEKNSMKFLPYVCGDDMEFVLEALLNANGIVFLNNFISYDYYVRDSPDDSSITNTVNMRFLMDLMEAYTYCCKCTSGYSREIQKISVDPHLFYWIYVWKNSSFTKEENRILRDRVNEFKKIHKTGIKTRLVLSLMTAAIGMSIRTSRR